MKIVVCKNIGSLSRECFGAPGTVLECVDGMIQDLDGFLFGQFVKYKSFEDIVIDFNRDDDFKTVFRRMKV